MKKVIGLLVFTDQKTLDHKIGDIACYWEMNNVPKGIEIDYHDSLRFFPYDEIRLYMAVKGIVKGYFLIESFLDMKGYWYWEIEDDSWHPIKNGEKKKGHQGFEYYLHDEEDSNG